MRTPTERKARWHFVTEASRTGSGSLGVRLLADLRALFTREQTDRMTSGEILAELLTVDDAPWGDLYGHPLNPRKLAQMLGRYGVEPRNLKRPGGGVAKGYRLDAGLGDAFRRYLTPAATSATSATAQVRPVADAEPPPLPPLPDQAEPP